MLLTERKCDCLFYIYISIESFVPVICLEWKRGWYKEIIIWERKPEEEPGLCSNPPSPSCSLEVCGFHLVTYVSICISFSWCWYLQPCLWGYINDSFRLFHQRTSLVAQWYRVRLPMQETQVRFLVWEDPTWHGATACAL